MVSHHAAKLNGYRHSKSPHLHLPLRFNKKHMTCHAIRHTISGRRHNNLPVSNRELLILVTNGLLIAKLFAFHAKRNKVNSQNLISTLSRCIFSIAYV